MKHIAHIVSLPRCRTAWLSQALTHAPLCYGLHDGVANHDDHSLLTPAQYARKILALPEPFITDCSSGIASMHDHLDVFSGPIVIIAPDSEARCRDSWIEHMNDPSLAERWQVVAGNFETTKQVFKDRVALSVPFLEINQFMPAIWSVCCPGVAYPEQRIHDLMRLAIQEIN